MSDKKKQAKDEKKFYELKEQKGSEYIFEIEVPAEQFKQSYDQLLKQKLESTDLKGFRKGKVPKEMIEQGLKPEVLVDTFERIAPFYVNQALVQEKVAPIAPPEYKDLDDMKLGQPVSFTVVVTVMPEFEIGDLSKVKVEEKSPKPTDEEVEKTLQTMFENNKSVLEKDFEEPNDEWAKEIGGQYQFDGDKVENLDDLKNIITESIKGQKQMIIDQEATSEVIKQAIKLSKIEVPEKAVEYEAEQREEAFMKDLEQIGTPLETFEKRNNVTIEQLRQKWHEDSLEALENDAFLRTFAETNKTEVTEEELQAEIDRTKQQALAKAEKPDDVDMSVYENPQWQAQIQNYLMKRKALNEFMEDVLPEEMKARVIPKEQPVAKEKKSAKTKPKKKAAKGTAKKEKKADSKSKKK